MSITDFSGSQVECDDGFIGPIAGAVVGNVTGNLTGNVTGNVTGNLTGNSAGVHTGGVVSSSVNIGSGGALVYAHKAAVAVDVANITAGTVLEVSVTVTGAATGDAVIVNPPTTLDAGLAMGGAYVSATDTVKMRIFNSTVGDINPASGNFVFTLIR